MAIPASSQSKYAALADELESIGRNGISGECDDVTRFRLLEATKAASPQLEKQAGALQRVLYTAYEVTAARIAMDLQLFEKLCNSPKPLTTQEVARATGANPRLMERLLKFMASVNLISEVDKGVFAPSITTRYFNDVGALGGLRTNTVTVGKSVAAFPAWLQSVKYQTPTDHMNAAFNKGLNTDLHLFPWFDRNAVERDQFGAWMTRQRFGGELWLDALPFADFVLNGANPEAPLFVDVGGGGGHQCANLVARYPQIADRVVLQDTEEVLRNRDFELQGRQRNLQDSEKVVADRETALETLRMAMALQTQPVDFFKEQPVQNARVYYLRNVLHDWTDRECCAILQVIKKAMGPNSMIFIDEMVVPDKGAHRITMQVDMTMLAVLAAEERSHERWHELFELAGLKLVKQFEYSPIVSDSILVVVPA